MYGWMMWLMCGWMGVDEGREGYVEGWIDGWVGG